MEKATKQRILGALVLLAGAGLFLPIILDGKGKEVTMAPIPQPPIVPSVEQLHTPPVVTQEPIAASEPVEEGKVIAEPVPPSEGKPVDEVKPVVSSAPVKPVEQTLAKPEPKVDVKLEEKRKHQEALDKEAHQKALALAKEKQKAADLKKIADLKKANEKAKEVNKKEPTVAKQSVALPKAWLIQVASLSNKEKAQELMSKLRAKKYRAQMFQSGSVWKVTIGPELDKDIADSIKVKISHDADLKLSPWVQPYNP